MKRFLLFFFVEFVLFTVNLFAAPFDMILTGDPILEDLRFLSLESKKNFLSFTPPFAPGEIENFIASIDESTLSTPAGEALSRVKKRLRPEAPFSLSGNFFSFQLHLNSTIEAKVRFNNDISWYPENPKISPALSFPLRFFFSDSLQLYFEPIIAADPDYYDEAETFGTNIPWQPNHLDLNMPLRAFVAAGGSWWNFQLGRDRLSCGTGHIGNLAISDNPAFYDFVRLSFFSDFFKYSMLISQMPLDIDTDLYSPRLETDSLQKTTQRHFYLHRLDFKLFDVLSIGLMEGLMAGNSALEIRYLNPLVLFHSLYSSWDYDRWGKEKDGHMNGSFFSVEVNWNIIKSFALYGQFVMNEFTTAFEAEGYDDVRPNGLGFMAGLDYTHSFDIWRANFFLEFIHTYPYLYMNSSPFSSFIQMRRLSLDPGRVKYYYMGYPRDTNAYTLGMNFSKGDKFGISGEFTWLSRGEHTIKWDWKETKDAFEEKTPTKVAENSFILGVDVQWKILSFLVLRGGVSGIYTLNNGHNSGSDQFGGQTAFSVSFLY